MIGTEGKLIVTVRDNGPLLLRGGFVLRSADHTAMRYGEKAAMCRCGHSHNKPFCDGTHKKIGFRTD
ncbi:MAG: CDGSH iron-sulfur domain-containing protein [Trueperaceae bacterium]|nr:MAG: CDGSH iron-sulfur domain-containing protein [Trueperaceae bacterium]